MEKANNKEALNLNNNYKYITPYTLGLVMASPTNCPIRIGDLLISTISRNPSEDYVGTEWEQIKDRFLLACGNTYSNGSIGGESTHILTVDEIPSHNHNHVSAPVNNGGSPWYTVATGSGSQIYWTATQNTGGGQAHNNMPPYLAVYMWKRIK